MNEQHECEHRWTFVVPYYKGAEKVFIVCRHNDCKMVLTKKMAVDMLNEYEILKKATERLNAKMAQSIYEDFDLEWGDNEVFTKQSKALLAYADILEGKDERT